MRPVTLVFCVVGNEVLLAYKKTGFGTGKINALGGKFKPEKDITLLDTAVRETREEARLIAEPSDLEKVAEIDFLFPEVSQEAGYDQTMHVYLLQRWRGEPRETMEMVPVWYSQADMPWDRMWPADKYWIPEVLEGKKLKATVTFAGKGESVKDYSAEVVEGF